MILVGCGSVTARSDGAATGGTPGTDAGARGSGGQGGASTGAAGKTGSGGAAGVAGATGSGGAAGATGSGGAAGVAGAIGSGGAAGAAGATGSGGAAGATGSGDAAGAAGKTGSGGVAGAIGSGGAAGVIGSGGAAGAAGKTGSGGAAGAGACSVQLLKNGDFEAGNVSWTAAPTDRRLIYLFGEIDPAIAPPSESDYVAWLGDKVVSKTVTLAQQIQVPANTLSVTISGSVYIQSDEDPTPYDFGYVETVANGMTDPEMSWSNANAGDAWVPFSVTRTPTWLPGQTATFRLRVVMDDATDTSFFFDNLSFVANLCP